MHSRKKGESGSKHPYKTKKSLWERYGKKETELLVEKLAKSNIPPSQIGITLRDAYGIPDVKLATGKKITAILKEKDILPKLPEDITSLIKREIYIMKHLEQNKKDMPAKRGLQLTESKINRLAKYYKRAGKIPQDWKFNRTQAKLLVE